jgi:hypothetical protein
MPATTIRYICFPRTEPPPQFASQIAEVFRQHEQSIGTAHLDKGLTSDGVLKVIRDDLLTLGFEVEKGKRSDQKIERPVFFGENGLPELRYEVDAFHPEWRCGLEVEAGRAWMGNAVYRDLIQALVMVQVDTLFLAVPNAYKYKTGGRTATSNDYGNARNVAETLFSHSRFRFPYGLVLLGY